MSFTVTQNLFLNDSTVITVVKCNDDGVSLHHLQPLLDVLDRVLGVSATYGKQSQLSSIAFSTLSRALVVNVPVRHMPQLKSDVKRCLSRGRRLLQDHLLTNPKYQKYAFKMDKLAVALHLDLSVRVSDAVDMLSVNSGGARDSVEALMDAMGGEMHLHKTNVLPLFFGASMSPMVDAAANVALQAWAACRAATLPHMSSRFMSLPRIDTLTFSKPHLDAVANISRHGDRLDALKPTAVKNDVRECFTVKKDAINLVSARFATRIKKSKNQAIQIQIEDEEATNQVVGRAREVNGRCARISVNGLVRGGKILSVTTFGKDNSTCAESTRQNIILEVLQHKTNIFSNPFFQALWLPEERPLWPQPKGQSKVLPVHSPFSLNTSQLAAVQKILSDNDDDRVVVIQGPPGTGKTTVIAASVMSHNHANSSQIIWVAAQSNVAVKNIAEKFVKEGFDRFRLLVSKDFHYDWHEHLYEELQSCLIRSDSFPKSTVEAARLLLDCKVILCTLSMFSNPNIDVFLHNVQPETIILDEASQIESGDYLPIFYHFHSTLSKLIFIGDDKQLPPYAQEDIPELRSVFEISHLRRQALFLDIQYRMPHVISTFISRNVYRGKLGTHHSHTTTGACACRFIDVHKGQEAKRGHSWINEEEARVVVKLARLYKKSRDMSFRIITPYDAQRSLIEDLLKREKLPWEDKVFNVDSFQGNEDDHIIVSVVRSQRPGFLRNQRRMNVMLTRCRKSMMICSSRAFMFGEASQTLVGKLAALVEERNWINVQDVVCGRIDLFRDIT